MVIMTMIIVNKIGLKMIDYNIYESSPQRSRDADRSGNFLRPESDRDTL